MLRPCATYCPTRLLDVFDITLYFSDDNIFPDAEWEKRLGEVKKLVDIVNNGQFEQKAKFPLKLHVKQYNYGNFLHCAKGLEKEREGTQGVKSALNCALTTLATLPTPTGSTTLPPLSPFPPTKTAKLSTPLKRTCQKSAVALHRLQKAQRLQRKRASVAKIRLVPPALLRMRLRPSTNATGAKTKGLKNRRFSIWRFLRFSLCCSGLVALLLCLAVLLSTCNTAFFTTFLATVNLQYFFICVFPLLPLITNLSVLLHFLVFVL